MDQAGQEMKSPRETLLINMSQEGLTVLREFEKSPFFIAFDELFGRILTNLKDQAFQQPPYDNAVNSVVHGNRLGQAQIMSTILNISSKAENELEARKNEAEKAEKKTTE